MAHHTLVDDNRLTLDLEGNSIAAFSVSSDHRLITCNHGAETLFGSPAQELIGQSCSHVMSRRLSAACLGCGQWCTRQLADDDSAPVRRPVVLQRGDGRSQILISVLRATTSEGEPCMLHLLQVAPLSQHAPAPSHPQADSISGSHSVEPHLTRREREILRMLSEGLETPDIAAQSSISSATVRNHVQNIIAKLGVSTRLQAVLKATEIGLI